MSSFSVSPDRADVFEQDPIQGVVTVGTSAVEAKVGGSPMTDRQMVVIYNKSNKSIYMGSSAVTTSNGVIISKGQTLSVMAGPDSNVYLIAATAGNDVVVQEWA